VNAQPPHSLHLINLHPPPPSITPHRRFTRCAQNRATNAWFFIFGPNLAPWPRVGECAAPLLPPSHQPAPTTSQHHPTSLFHMACPKLSHQHLVFDFWPKSRPLASCWRMHSPLAASSSSNRTQYLPVSPYIAVSHGVPKTKPLTLGFRLFGPNPAP
jgi:hypothetical protein